MDVLYVASTTLSASSCAATAATGAYRVTITCFPLSPCSVLEAAAGVSSHRRRIKQLISLLGRSKLHS
jgi:hypothetical protein